MANWEEEETLPAETESLCQQATSNSCMESIVETDAKKTAQDMKYDWYQKDDDVIITLFVKVIDKENFNISFSDDSISISLTDDENVVRNLNLSLYDCIKPLECSYKLLTTKVEVKLKKLNNRFWSDVEKKKDHNCNIKQQVNWDRLVKNEMPADEANGDISVFFQKIYNDGTDEVKKAMIKSFYESCGTVLTTNWTEASLGEVSVHAPDGVEWKKW